MYEIGPILPSGVWRPTFVRASHLIRGSPHGERQGPGNVYTDGDGSMNFRRIALMVAILAVPCTANAFWFGGNGSCGSCGGQGGCGSSCESSCDCGHSSCGSHGGSFGGCLSHLF